MSYDIQYTDLTSITINSGQGYGVSSVIISPNPANTIDLKAVIISVTRMVVTYPTDTSKLDESEKSYVF